VQFVELHVASNGVIGMIILKQSSLFHVPKQKQQRKKERKEKVRKDTSKGVDIFFTSRSLPSDPTLIDITLERNALKIIN
jgi:hypothetical protein